MSKQLYERIVCWMADYEAPELLEESLSADQQLDITAYLMEAAFDIMYDICQEVQQ